MITEVVAIVGALAACAYVIVGMARYIAEYTKSTNQEYKVLLRAKETETANRLKAEADRDKWKLHAMKYGDQRQKAIDVAKHYRDKYTALTIEIEKAKAAVTIPDMKLVVPPTIAPSLVNNVLPASESGIAQFNIERMHSEIAAGADQSKDTLKTTTTIAAVSETTIEQKQTK